MDYTCGARVPEVCNYFPTHATGTPCTSNVFVFCLALCLYSFFFFCCYIIDFKSFILTLTATFAWGILYHTCYSLALFNRTRGVEFIDTRVRATFTWWTAHACSESKTITNRPHTIKIVETMWSRRLRPPSINTMFNYCCLNASIYFFGLIWNCPELTTALIIASHNNNGRFVYVLVTLW